MARATAASVSDAAGAASGMEEEHVFRWDGERWTIRFGERTIRLPDSTGLRYLAVLLRRPGERVDVVDVRAAAAPVRRRGRRSRTSVQTLEPARVGVTKGIKRAIATISAQHPVLAAHLEATVRCGYFCRYAPDPRHPIAWRK